MIRELQVNMAKNVPASRVAAVPLVTGMGVVISDDGSMAALPGTEAGHDVFFVEQERVPTGINTARLNMSDYDPDFVNVPEGVPVQIIPVYAHERYATDQYDDTGLDVGDAVAVGTDGRWKRASVPSAYRYMGPYNDAGHELIIVEKFEEAKTN